MPNQTGLRHQTAPLGSFTVNRMGYGAMQLAGPHVFGPPRDRAEAIAVLREAVANGVNHIDTSDYYGPFVVNEIIREALDPYPADLVLVTKPFYLLDTYGAGTSHGAPHPYDTHAVFLTYGPGIPGGKRTEPITPLHAAAINADYLNIRPPIGNEYALPVTLR